MVTKLLETNVVTLTSSISACEGGHRVGHSHPATAGTAWLLDLSYLFAISNASFKAFPAVNQLDDQPPVMVGKRTEFLDGCA